MGFPRPIKRPRYNPSRGRFAGELARGFRGMRDLATLPVDLPLARMAGAVGVVGVVVGVVALLGAWIPLVGLMTLPLSLSGVLLSAAGLLMGVAANRRGIRWPLRGIAVNGFAVLVAIVSLPIFLFLGALNFELSGGRAELNELQRRLVREAEQERANRLPSPARVQQPPVGAPRGSLVPD